MASTTISITEFKALVLSGLIEMGINSDESVQISEKISDRVFKRYGGKSRYFNSGKREYLSSESEKIRKSIYLGGINLGKQALLDYLAEKGICERRWYEIQREGRKKRWAAGINLQGHSVLPK